MKTIHLAIPVATTALFWLLCSFILWDFNPANWSEDARLFVALSSVLFSGGAIAAYEELA